MVDIWAYPVNGPKPVVTVLVPRRVTVVVSVAVVIFVPPLREKAA